MLLARDPMLDLHLHALPGLDDGPATMEESAALCRRAAEEGTTHVVATPHVLREPPIRGWWA